MDSPRPAGSRPSPASRFADLPRRAALPVTLLLVAASGLADPLAGPLPGEREPMGAPLPYEEGYEPGDTSLQVYSDGMQSRAHNAGKSGGHRIVTWANASTGDVHQVATYYNDAGDDQKLPRNARVVLAHRLDGETTWQRVETPFRYVESTREYNDGGDHGHRGIGIGIDPGGHLHITWALHGNPILRQVCAAYAVNSDLDPFSDPGTSPEPTLCPDHPGTYYEYHYAISRLPVDAFGEWTCTQDGWDTHDCDRVWQMQREFGDVDANPDYGAEHERVVAQSPRYCDGIVVEGEADQDDQCIEECTTDPENLLEVTCTSGNWMRDPPTMGDGTNEDRVTYPHFFSAGGRFFLTYRNMGTNHGDIMLKEQVAGAAGPEWVFRGQLTEGHREHSTPRGVYGSLYADVRDGAPLRLHYGFTFSEIPPDEETQPKTGKHLRDTHYMQGTWNVSADRFDWTNITGDPVSLPVYPDERGPLIIAYGFTTCETAFAITYPDGSSDGVRHFGFLRLKGTDSPDAEFPTDTEGHWDYHYLWQRPDGSLAPHQMTEYTLPTFSPCGLGREHSRWFLLADGETVYGVMRPETDAPYVVWSNPNDGGYDPAGGTFATFHDLDDIHPQERRGLLETHDQDQRGHQGVVMDWGRWQAGMDLHILANDARIFVADDPARDTVWDIDGNGTVVEIAREDLRALQP